MYSCYVQAQGYVHGMLMNYILFNNIIEHVKIYTLPQSDNAVHVSCLFWMDKVVKLSNKLCTASTWSEYGVRKDCSCQPLLLYSDIPDKTIQLCTIYYPHIFNLFAFVKAGNCLGARLGWPYCTSTKNELTDRPLCKLSCDVLYPDYTMAFTASRFTNLFWCFWEGELAG